MNVQQALAGVKSIQGALRVLALLQLTAHRFPQEAKVQECDTFEYIVVGAGSAGSVLANRLTEDPSIRVLLVEAGGDPPIDSVLPGLMTYLPNSHVDWNYTTTKEKATECHIDNVYKATRGKMLGGSSSLNYMGYLRGDRVTYNTWANITKDPSWSYDNDLQYFMKSERLEDAEILRSSTGHLHGTHGYLGVTTPRNPDAIPFLKSFEEAGHKIVLDTNGHRLGYGEFTFTKANGVRQSTAEAFLSPICGRSNFYVLKNTKATKILIDKQNNAYGVQLLRKDKKPFKVIANIEVVVSAGALNSPQLLMLSGIGPKKHLRKHRIPVIADLPVGQNLLDDIGVVLVHTLGKVSNSSPPLNPHDIPSAIINGFVSVDGTPYPNYQTLSMVLRADAAATMCAFNFAFNFCEKLYRQGEGKEVFLSILIDSERKSTGEVLLRSSSPLDQPIIKLNAFSKTIDLVNTARYIRDFLQVQNTSYFRTYKAELFEPDCVKGLAVGSDEYWKKFCLCMSASIFHYGGTCKMGDIKTSVLDSRLRVIGVNRLRVVDASAMPVLPRANPNPAVIMMAEKAADMIKQDNVKWIKDRSNRC